MNEMLVSQFLLILGFIIIGYICCRSGVLNQKANDVLSSFVLKVTLPATILNSALRDMEMDRMEILTVLAAAAWVHLLIPFMSHLLAKVFRLSSTVELMLNYSNIGFMGFPIITRLYGEAYGFYVAIFLMVFNIHLFTIGVLTLEKEKGEDSGGITGQKKTNRETVGSDWFRRLYSPGIAAAAIAFLIVMLRIRVPGLAEELVSSVSAATTPLAMIVIGSQLAGIPMKTMLCNRKLYFLAGIKLAVYPMLIWFLMSWLIGPGMIARVATILVGLPAAGSVVMLCSQHGGDAELAVQSIFVDLMLSFLTLPVLLIWIG